ncbi:MAG TPA: PDZ domain-containing protein [Aquaticitalea sp.]|nr:PDZ domain-containing protein [Aquaticitalea sp.]
MKVNGAELSFLLDSGVSKPILFNIVNMSDSLHINHVESIYIRGLGDQGSVEALKSKKNVIQVGEAVKDDQDIFVIFDEDINFTPRLGVPVHGIIGYDIFKDFIVEVNYASKYLMLFDPKTYQYKKCKKCKTLDLDFHQNKPYINAKIEIHDSQVPVKLLIDSGSSDALWLFEEDSLGIVPHGVKFFDDFLGKGLSGSIYGKRTRIGAFSLGDFHLNKVNAAFPEASAIGVARSYKERNGSVAGEILKRFNLIVDYGNQKLTLKKNKYFKKPFNYNMSGITLEQEGFRIVKEQYDAVAKDDYGNRTNSNSMVTVIASYRFMLKPAFKVVELREGSPAEQAGLIKNDIVLKINGNETKNLTLQEVNKLLQGDDGDFVKMTIDRNGFIILVSFRLKSLF